MDEDVSHYAFAPDDHLQPAEAGDVAGELAEAVEVGVRREEFDDASLPLDGIFDAEGEVAAPGEVGVCFWGPGAHAGHDERCGVFVPGVVEGHGDGVEVDEGGDGEVAH